MGAPRFEVLVVDDGSADGTREVLQRLVDDAAGRLDLRPLHLARNVGPATARNVGWRAARAPLIAFTDDDCTPQPGWVAALARALGHVDVAQGRTTRDPTDTTTGWFAWAPEVSSEGGFYETCNIGYRRAVLDAVGGFDESFRPRRSSRSSRYVAPVWGEDTDLALRAKSRGATSAFVDDAVVWHDVKPGRLRDRLADLPRRGGTVALVKRHPSLRARLESRWFVQRAHASALVGVVAVVIAVRSRGRSIPWAMTAGILAVWARQRGVHYPMRAWPRVLPQWLAVDLAEVAVLAAASLRERTLLL